MSTRGCFGFYVDGECHLIPSCNDSYPECLGSDIVEQVRRSDLNAWAALSRKLCPTARDNELTEEEIRHIKQWFAACINGEWRLEGDRPPSSEQSIVQMLPDYCIEGARLAEAIEPDLSMRPGAFWRLLWGNCEAILRLGLYQPADGGFVSSPFCEWAYVIDFDGRQFLVGEGDYDPEEFMRRPHDQEVEGRIRVLARFPLDAIPRDWVRVVR